MLRVSFVRLSVSYWRLLPRLLLRRLAYSLGQRLRRRPRGKKGKTGLGKPKDAEADQKDPAPGAAAAAAGSEGLPAALVADRPGPEVHATATTVAASATAAATGDAGDASGSSWNWPGHPLYGQLDEDFYEDEEPGPSEGLDDEWADAVKRAAAPPEASTDSDESSEDGGPELPAWAVPGAAVLVTAGQHSGCRATFLGGGPRAARLRLVGHGRRHRRQREAFVAWDSLQPRTGTA